MFNSVFSVLRFGNHDRLPHPEDCQSYFTCLITGLKRFTTTTIHFVYFTFKKEALDWPTADGRRCSITRPDNAATPRMCRDGELTALVIVFIWTNDFQWDLLDWEAEGGRQWRVLLWRLLTIVIMINSVVCSCSSHYKEVITI